MSGAFGFPDLQNQYPQPHIVLSTGNNYNESGEQKSGDIIINVHQAYFQFISTSYFFPF